MTALAEVLWSAVENKSWSSFQQRLKPVVNQLKGLSYTVAESDCKVLASATVESENLCVNLSVASAALEIRYTLDGSKPTIQSEIYQLPLPITAMTVVRAIAFDSDNNKAYGDERLTVVPHKAIGKTISVQQASEQTASLLVNGQLATDRIFQFHEWYAIDESGLTAIIELESLAELSGVDIGYQAGLYRTLYLPTAIKLWVSTDQQEWQLVAAVETQQIQQSSPRIDIPFSAIYSRYLKVDVENTNRGFSEEDNAVIAMPVYIDEIVVR